MLVPLRGWMVLGLLIGMIVLSYYRAYDELLIPYSKDQRTRTQLAQRWAQKVATEVKRLPGRPVVAVARVVNDSDGILTGQLKTWIARRNVLMVNDQWYANLDYAAGVTDEPPTIEAAIHPLIRDDVDFIIAAEVENWTTFPEFEAVLRGHVEIRDGRTGESLLQFDLALADMIEVTSVETEQNNLVAVETLEVDRLESDVSLRPEEFGDALVLKTSTASLVANFPYSPVLGLTLWLGTVLSLPLVAWPRLRRLLSRQCNQTNLGLLAVWILVTGALAVTLWVRFLPLISAVLSGTLAVVLAVLYFGFCCQCLDKSV